jgi:purine-binding chemotaxis protein CheW
MATKLTPEEYGIDILRVQAIRWHEKPTRIANAPPIVKRVVNLRGVIVPIIDMRLEFNLANVRYGAYAVVVVLNIGSRVVGMVVDAVSDVVTLTPEQLRAVPEFN